MQQPPLWNCVNCSQAGRTYSGTYSAVAPGLFLGGGNIEISPPLPSGHPGESFELVCFFRPPGRAQSTLRQNPARKSPLTHLTHPFSRACFAAQGWSTQSAQESAPRALLPQQRPRLQPHHLLRRAREDYSGELAVFPGPPHEDRVSGRTHLSGFAFWFHPCVCAEQNSCVVLQKAAVCLAA